ncbi:MAG: pyridoxamine 5'-phosphate oxidase family protein [Paludibacteraceae bacterium]|nr:pyridoxamine 5'-phosphate oxidase family protein [Paludibacteraceae bacterium]
MTKEQIFEIINGMQAPVMSVATVENGQPHVRGILLYKADENGIVFHTGAFKDLYKQLITDPRSEVCFNAGKYQIRVEGNFELVDDVNLKREIINHPSRKFLQGWIAEQGEQAVIDFIQVFRMQHGKAHVWTFEDNFKAKEYVTL